MQGHQLSLISLDDGGNSTRTLEHFKSMVQDSKVLGIAGMMESADIADVVRNFTASKEGSTIPIIGPVSGLQTLRNLKNVLNVRQSYRDEFYAIFRHLRESDIIKAAILCENWDPIMRTACTDAQQALNSTQVPSNLPISISVNFDSFALETVVDGLNNLRLFDDIKWNIPLQMVIYVGRNASVFMSVAYRMKASNAKLVYATGSFMDRQRLTEEAQKISLDLSKIVHSSPFPYSPLVVEQLKKYNVANDSLTLSAQEGKIDCFFLTMYVSKEFS
ncbi:hypothetical protein BKA69DRAFT_201440 [Paraphysoderma sedebokerense]|nr:hypothetical protein BKA69DRAFT_201440 [Paraphysoderma sedebokerense]